MRLRRMCEDCGFWFSRNSCRECGKPLCGVCADWPSPYLYSPGKGMCEACRNKIKENRRPPQGHSGTIPFISPDQPPFPHLPSLQNIVQEGTIRTVSKEKEVIEIIAILPGKFRYEQVEAAINASGVSPRAIYENLAANQPTLVLTRFYEALYGPGWKP